MNNHTTDRFADFEAFRAERKPTRSVPAFQTPSLEISEGLDLRTLPLGEVATMAELASTQPEVARLRIRHASPATQGTGLGLGAYLTLGGI